MVTPTDAVKYKIATHQEASGAPVIYCSDDGIFVVAVHRTGVTHEHPEELASYSEGSVLTQAFLSRMKETFELE